MTEVHLEIFHSLGWTHDAVWFCWSFPGIWQAYLRQISSHSSGLTGEMISACSVWGHAYLGGTPTACGKPSSAREEVVNMETKAETEDEEKGCWWNSLVPDPPPWAPQAVSHSFCLFKPVCIGFVPVDHSVMSTPLSPLLTLFFSLQDPACSLTVFLTRTTAPTSLRQFTFALHGVWYIKLAARKYLSRKRRKRKEESDEGREGNREEGGRRERKDEEGKV